MRAIVFASLLSLGGCFVPCKTNSDCNRGEVCDISSGKCFLAPDSGSALTAFTGPTPVVIYSLPSDGTYGVPPTSTISVVWSTAMSTATLTNQTFVVRQDDGSNIDGIRTADATLPIWRFTPVIGYANNRRVDITIVAPTQTTAGAVSATGVPLALDHKFSFVSVTQ